VLVENEGLLDDAVIAFFFIFIFVHDKERAIA